MEDQIAISRLKQGDLYGLESLVDRYQVRAVHAAFMIVFDRGQAEDVVQNAFVKVAERIHQFDETQSFAPWFLRIVVNDALKLASKQKRLMSLDKQQDEATTRMMERLVDPHMLPEEWVMQKETRQAVLDAIKSLPPERRAVIVMQYFLDMSEQEMVLKVGRPLSTIKWWLRDARKRLRRIMDTPQV